MAALFRRPGALVALGTSALGGAAYRFSTEPPTSDSLNTHTFTPYTLISKTPVSSTNAIFTLRNRDGVPDPAPVRDIESRSIWSIQIKQPQLQIARDYTPLPPATHLDSEGHELTDMRLLIRKEEGGEVSGYLHRLPEQSTIEMRGPKIEWEVPADVEEVIFLAGGTGIAPALQAASVMGARPGTRMHLLWANRRREECVGGVSDGAGVGKKVTASTSRVKSWLGFGAKPAVVQEQTHLAGYEHGHEAAKGVIVQELDALKKRNAARSSTLEVQYYIDEENKYIKPQDVLQRIAAASPEKKGSRVILISGPDGFIEYWAGKKLWIGGRETQGPLGGVLGEADLKGWSVYKL